MKVLWFAILFAFASAASAEKPTSAPTPPADFDGWAKNSPAWLDNKRLKIIDNINFTSYFMNNNVKYKISTKRGKLLFDIYSPIARFRFKHDFYHFPIERRIRDKLLA